MPAITFDATFAGWRRAARAALADGAPPAAVDWREAQAAQGSLGLVTETTSESPASTVRVPRRFHDLARNAACHRDAGRWALLYRVLWRLTHGEHALLDVASDPDVHALLRLDAAVRRDVHKMHAFVRFRVVARDDGEWHVAWFEPEHHIVERATPFFADRFASMRWSILTPERCAHWDRHALTFTDGVPRPRHADADEVQSLWLTYYGNIFNPARIKTDAMRAEMPKRYWANLPEAATIPTLLREAPARVRTMIADSDARRDDRAEWHPATPPTTSDLDVLRAAASGCTACPLHATATQTVFGEGAADADIVLVGEQPGDEEDRRGRPFVGPAGRLLDRALADAGIARERCWVTNVVKHFKWEPRGKRRIHQTPGARDVAACRPWMDAELMILRPRVLVCLGATAARAIVGSSARVERDRGVLRPWRDDVPLLITVHPSFVIRLTDARAHEAEYARLVADLRVARQNEQ